MCGIIGFVGSEAAAPVVLEGLLKLEYRGYDSAGLASIRNGRLHLKKDAGRIEEIDDEEESLPTDENLSEQLNFFKEEEF